MAQIYVLFGTVGAVANAVNGAVFSDNSSIGIENPSMTLVTVDDFNGATSQVYITDTWYDVLYTKSDGASGLVYDSNLEDYYTNTYLEDKGIDDSPFKPGEYFIDDDFTGLTEEESLDFIYSLTPTRTRFTVETTPDWSNLRDALSPNDSESLLTIFKYDSTFIHVISQTADNEFYFGYYDNAQTAGTRWSGWAEGGGSESDPIKDNDNFTSLVDADFTGLTAEECLTAIYGDELTNTRVSIETDSSFPVLQTQLCPSGKESMLVFLKQGNLINVTCKGLDNTEYVAIYDYSQTEGNRWSDWSQLTNQGGYTDPIADNNSFTSLVDADFTGLTPEACLDAIYSDTGNDTRISIETETDYPILEAQLCPDGNPSFLEFFKYDSSFVYVTARMQDNTMYIATYDNSQISGSRWSSWNIITGTDIVTLSNISASTDDGTTKYYTVPEIDNTANLVVINVSDHSTDYQTLVFQYSQLKDLYDETVTSIRSDGQLLDVELNRNAENIVIERSSTTFYLDYITIYKFGDTTLDGGTSDDISDDKNFKTLVDADFTGLSAESCLSAIYGDTNANTRISIETEINFPILESQFCPDAKACLLVFTKLNSTVINVVAQAQDNTEYIGVFDYSLGEGNRWSDWTELTNQSGYVDPISDNDNFSSLVDSDFTGLSEEECLDSIFADTSANTRISIETETDFPILESQFCPSAKACYLEFFMGNDDYIHVSAKASDNTYYMGTYDSSQTSGSRWSGWLEITNQGGTEGTYTTIAVTIPKNSSQIIGDIVGSQLVVLEIVRSSTYSTTRTSMTFIPSMSGNAIYQTWIDSSQSCIIVDFETGNVSNTTGSSSNVFISNITIYTVN